MGVACADGTHLEDRARTCIRAGVGQTVERRTHGFIIVLRGARHELYSHAGPALRRCALRR